VNDDADLLVDVRAWLEGRGYVLEMRVAQLLSGRRIEVDQGYAYTDVETKKDREGDISALVDIDTEDDHWHMLDLLIECKSTNDPWIGFRGDKWGNGPWTAGSYMDLDCALCETMLVRFAHLRRKAAPVYSLTEKRNGTAKDHAYEAARQATSAALGKYSESKLDGHEDASIISILVVPIVVTTSPLVLCSLDENGEVTLESVDRMNVTVARLDTPEPGADGLEVLVVRERALEALVEDLEHLTDDWRLEVAP